MSVYTHGHLFYALDYSALLYILLFKQFQTLSLELFISTWKFLTMPETY